MAHERKAGTAILQIFRRIRQFPFRMDNLPTQDFAHNDVIGVICACLFVRTPPFCQQIGNILNPGTQLFQCVILSYFPRIAGIAAYRQRIAPLVAHQTAGIVRNIRGNRWKLVFAKRFIKLLAVKPDIHIDTKLAYAGVVPKKAAVYLPDAVKKPIPE